MNPGIDESASSVEILAVGIKIVTTFYDTKKDGRHLFGVNCREWL